MTGGSLTCKDSGPCVGQQMLCARLFVCARGSKVEGHVSLARSERQIAMFSWVQDRQRDVWVEKPELR